MRTTAIASTTVALTLLGANIATADVQPNIVGGTAATGETDWAVSMTYDAPDYGKTAAPWCGGTLVFRKWVLSNAHCFTNNPDAPGRIPVEVKSFTVRAGSKDRTKGGETAKVISIKVNPGWNWTKPNAPKCEIRVPRAENPACDIVMLELDHPVNVQPIQLAGQAARPGARITLYGWGSDDPSGDTSNMPVQLQQLRTKVLPPERCADAGQSAGEICTDNPHGTDGPGGGDSGTPAVMMVDGVPQLVGGCSRAAAEYPGESPTVYTSSPDFRNWIYNTARGVPTAGV